MLRITIVSIVCLAAVVLLAFLAWASGILRLDVSTTFTPPSSAPLDVAIMQNEPLDKIRQILDQNPSLARSGGMDGGTPVHAAVLRDRPDIVELLLDRGADVNAAVLPGTVLAGKTPLMLAALQGSEPMVRLLLARGAAITTKDAKGETAADWARRARREDLAGIIEGDAGVGVSTRSTSPVLP